MKKTKISILSNALMFLSLSVMVFSYVPNVYAEDTTTEPIIEDSTIVEGLNTDNTQSIDENVSNDSDQIPENNEGNDSDEEQKLNDNTSVITNEVTPSSVTPNEVTNPVEELQPTDSNDGEPALTTGKAKIGDTYYATLSDAVNSITDGTQTTIEILEDDLYASGIIVPSGRNITFNFNGHTYNVTHDFAGSTNSKNQSFQLLKDSTIVMNNGTIKNANTSNSFIIQNYSNLTLTNMVIDGRDNSNVSYALSSNSGHVVINGSTSIYAANGRRAFDMCWAPNAGYPEGTQIVVNTTGTISGIIELDTWGGFKEGVPVASTLLIKNIKHVGTFSIEEGFTNELTITGGEFSTMPNVSNLAEGLVIVANGDTYTVVEGKAKIGDAYYATLSDAVNSITDGTNTTIDVLSDDLNASGIIVPSGRNITFNFNGHTYNVTGNFAGSTGTKNQSFQLYKDSTIVMNNGTIKNANTSGYSMIIQNYSNLTLTDMVLDGRDNSLVTYALSSNNGHVVINGSTSIYAANGRVAFDMCWAPNNSYVDGTQIEVDTTGTVSGKIELDTWGGFKEGVPVASTLLIKNIKHIGNFQVSSSDAALLNNLTISGGLYTNQMDASYLEEGYAVVPINNLYEVRKLDTSALTVVEEDGNTYLCENGAHVGYNGALYVKSARTSYVFKNGIVDKDFTGTDKVDKYTVYFTNGEKDVTVNGTKEIDGVQYLFNKGVLSNYTGAKYVKDDKTSYVFKNGVVDTKFNGIAVVDGRNVYFTNGKKDTSKNEIITHNNNKYAFEDGVAYYTGAKYMKKLGTSFVLNNGIIDTYFTGIDKVDKYIVYFTNGEKNINYNGVKDYKGNTYLFNKGIASNYTGAKYVSAAQTSYVFKNGVVDTTFTGIKKVGKYTVYFTNGEKDTTVNGIKNDNEEQRIFEKGVSYYTGAKYIKSLGTSYVLNDGVINKNFNGVDIVDKYVVYFKDGQKDDQFNGPYYYNNNIYQFKSGVCRL